MNGAQFLWSAHVGLALIAHDLVGHGELFEQPQHALRAGIVEMVHRQHGRPLIDGPRWCQPGAGKSRWLARGPGSLTGLIYPGNISPDLRNAHESRAGSRLYRL